MMMNFMHKENLLKHVESPKNIFIVDVKVEIKSNALNAINLSVKDIVISFVEKFTNSHYCWEYLIEAKSCSRKLILLKTIVSMKKEQKISLDNYFREVKKIVDQLEGVDFSIPQELLILMILKFLLVHYSIFVKTLTSKNSLPTLRELEPRLVNEKLHIKLDVNKETLNKNLVI